MGVVGCGQISGAYLRTLNRLAGVRVSALADMVAERASEAAEHVPGASVLTPQQLVSSPDVDLVLNLTVPAAHAEVALAGLSSGKHVYNEKPLAATRHEGVQLLAAAEGKGVRLGCAPDTVLGTGTQTARAVIDQGGIGTPHAATAFMPSPGHEIWHHRPQFYYQPGGGPLFDMGPYYLTALVHLLGPVTLVAGASSRPRATRTVGSGPLAGTTFASEVDTHITGILQHASGALTTLVMSFEMWAANLPKIEVHGTEGSLSVPDPNGFGGEVKRFSPKGQQWETVEDCAGYIGASRGYGVAEIAEAIATGRPHRANGRLAHHVLDVMVTLMEGAQQRAWLEVESSCERPDLVPLTALPEVAGTSG